MLFHILLIFSVAFSEASILSATYNDGSCASNSRIAFYYDGRENTNCSSIGCSPVGDGNFYEVRCDTPIALDNSGFAVLNYYESMTSCGEESNIMAYGGIPNNNAVKIYHQTSNEWISIQFILMDTAQITLCNLTEIPTCTTQFLPSSCTLNLNLEAGFYWKYTSPTTTPLEVPIESPLSTPYTTDEAPSDPLPSVPTDVPFNTPMFIEAPLATTTDSPVTYAPEQQDIVRCNCDDLSNCRCHLSCQMVDDVVTCALG